MYCSEKAQGLGGGRWGGFGGGGLVKGNGGGDGGVLGDGMGRVGMERVDMRWLG